MCAAGEDAGALKQFGFQVPSFGWVLILALKTSAAPVPLVLCPRVRHSLLFLGTLRSLPSLFFVTKFVEGLS